MNRIEEKAERFLAEQADDLHRRIDRIFAVLLLVQWAFAIGLALFLSPYAWQGKTRAVHLHVYLAVFLGGAISSLPLALIALRPGQASTRQVVAAAQMLWSALLIHLTGGRIETHFHVFGSLAFLAFYRDWTVLPTAAAVVAADHFLRGILWPESVYGVVNPEWWRFLEHAFWVSFTLAFVAPSCLSGIAQMREVARRRAESEHLAETLEERVKQRTAQLAEAQRIAHLGSWEYDLAAGRMSWSEEMMRILDAREGVGRARDALGRVHPGDRARVLQAFTRLRREGAPFELELRMVRPGGEVRIVLTRGQAAPGRLAGTVEDVTEQRAVETRLRQSEKLSLVGQFAAGIAHEVNNPLCVIQGFAQAIERRVRQDDPLRFAVESIARESTRCRDLIGELLTFSRVGVAARETVDLNALVHSSTLALESRARKQEVSVVRELDPQLGPVQANKAQLQRVLQSLGANALDAMEGGGVLLLRTRRDAMREVTIEVQDNGKGIPHEVRGRLFEPFFTTKETGRGTGLGLALAYEIMRQHGGHIEVRSEVGKGTTMTVRLPAENRP